jgi:hypothetical protein
MSLILPEPRPKSASEAEIILHTSTLHDHCEEEVVVQIK